VRRSSFRGGAPRACRAPVRRPLTARAPCD
jgi:hypothetical protein